MRDHVVLFINGQRHQLGYGDAAITLAEFLRERLRLVGTKIVCNEGDCGACSVLVGRRCSTGRLEYRTVDACITFLFQLDRTHVVTVEGLSRSGELTPLQAAMVHCHGSQCGFCTPGMVTAMHGIIESKRQLDDASLRYGLSGNLCRCTGYQQIFEAGKSVDCNAIETMNQLYSDHSMIDQFDALGEHEVTIVGAKTIYLPRTVKQACQWQSTHPTATVVSGATDLGVLYNHGRLPPRDVLCLNQIEDFAEISIDDHRLSIGGGATWTDIEPVVEKLFPPYHEIVTRFGSPQIRNSGTLAGNLATGSPIADSIPFHLVMESDLHLVSARGDRVVSLNEFYSGYRENVAAEDELIAKIETPRLAANERLALFKVSKRRDMDISTLTFALRVRIDGDSVDRAWLAIGGAGPTVCRITPVEEHFAGSVLSFETFRRAGEIARDHISPWSDVRGSRHYRQMLAENLLLKAYHEFAGELSAVN